MKVDALTLARLSGYLPPALFVLIEFMFLTTYVFPLMNNNYKYQHLTDMLPPLFSAIDSMSDVNYFFLSATGDQLKGWNIMIFNTFLLSMITITLMRIYFTDPGKVPKKWSAECTDRFQNALLKRDFKDQFQLPDDVQDQLYSGDNKKILSVMTNRLNYCQYCQSFKPERAGHCFEARQCVLRIQQYFYLLKICIGFYNYKFYYLMLFYTTLTLSYIDLVYFITFLECWVFQNDVWQSIIISFILLVSSLLTAVIAYMFVLHSYLIVKNYTIGEFLAQTGKKKKNTKNKYDLGVIDNIKAVLGDNPVLWFIPTIPSFRGKGLRYPVANQRRDDL